MSLGHLAFHGWTLLGEVPGTGNCGLFYCALLMASLVAQPVMNLLAMQETQVLSLGQEPLEKEMATHFSILAWEILWTDEPGRLQSIGL